MGKRKDSVYAMQRVQATKQHLLRAQAHLELAREHGTIESVATNDSPMGQLLGCFDIGKQMGIGSLPSRRSSQVARLASRDRLPAEDVLYGQSGKAKPVSRLLLHTLPKEEEANMLRQCQIDGEPEEEIEAIHQDIGMNPPFGESRLPDPLRGVELDGAEVDVRSSTASSSA